MLPTFLSFNKNKGNNTLETTFCTARQQYFNLEIKVIPKLINNEPLSKNISKKLMYH